MDRARTHHHGPGRSGPPSASGRADTCDACRTDRATIRHVRRRDPRALHTAVRFDDRSQTERLAELAKTLNTPLAEAIAEHARGLADHDGDLLYAAADQRGEEIKSSTRAHRLASQHEIRTPAVHSVVQPLPITDLNVRS